MLDVGCGNWPSMRANILADRFPWDDTERSHPLVLDERPFLICDALRLPFKDKAVDHVVCSHLAEHLDQPEHLFAELSRVGKAGYIECPGRIRELLHGWAFHRWYVSRGTDELLLEQKPRPVHDPEIQAWFTRHFEGNPDFEAFFVDNLDRFGLVTRYRWSGSVRYRVVRTADEAWTRLQADPAPPQGTSFAELGARLAEIRARKSPDPFVKRWLSRVARRESDRRTKTLLPSILCCPACRGDLVRVVANQLRCQACGASYPHWGNIYYLVAELAGGSSLGN